MRREDSVGTMTRESLMARKRSPCPVLQAGETERPEGSGAGASGCLWAACGLDNRRMVGGDGIEPPTLAV